MACVCVLTCAYAHMYMSHACELGELGCTYYPHIYIWVSLWTDFREMSASGLGLREAGVLGVVEAGGPITLCSGFQAWGMEREPYTGRPEASGGSGLSSPREEALSPRQACRVIGLRVPPRGRGCTEPLALHYSTWGAELAPEGRSRWAQPREPQGSPEIP